MVYYYAPLASLAAKAGGVVGAARAVVNRLLRVGAQRTSYVHFSFVRARR